MKIAIFLPRGMSFGPSKATAIDLCVRDFVKHSQYKATTRVYGEALEAPFADVPFEGVARRSGQSQRQFAKALADQAKGFAPDLVVIHQHTPSALVIRKAFTGRPAILHKHNTPRIPKSFFSRWKAMRDYRQFDRILLVSNYSLRAFVEGFPALSERTTVQHNGLDLGQWTASPERTRSVLFVGRAAPEKGALAAAEATASALRNANDWTADFILSTLGANQEYADAVKTALSPLGDRARIRQDVPHEAVAAAYETAAIALVPSVFAEPFGRTAIEAMAGGAALVTSLSGGLAEIADGVAERIDPTSASSIADAISRLIASPERRQDLSDAGRQRVAANFSIQSLSQRLDSLYEGVAQKREETD